MKRAALVVPVALALFAAAGCGGSKSLSRQELIAKAEPLCRRANHTLDSSKMTLHNYASVALAVAGVEHQVSDELAKLSPPESMSADWRVIVDGFRRAGVGLEEVAKAAPPHGNKLTPELRKGVNELSNGQHVRAVTALRNGFKECATY